MTTDNIRQFLKEKIVSTEKPLEAKAWSTALKNVEIAEAISKQRPHREMPAVNQPDDPHTVDFLALEKNSSEK